MSEEVILVAEDDPSVRMTLEFVLKDGGFEVVCASNGEEALEKAKALLPAAILLDQIMPKMEGKEVFKHLRDDEATRGIPVLVLSGMAGDRKGWEGAEFVGKPFSPDELIERIRKRLAGS